MNLRAYFPSAQFTLIVSSILISGGLVIAAEKYTRSSSMEDTPSSLTVGVQPSTDWLQTLREIQAQNTSYTLPPPPSENAVATLLEAARTDNITDSVGRTLLVSLSEAKSQGLGGDIPTQEKLVASAIAQIEQERGTPRYTSNNLSIVGNTGEAQRAYGNALMVTMAAHPDANYYQTLLAVGLATDSGNSAELAPLTRTGTAYSALAADLAGLQVPETLVPLHLQIVNNFARMASLTGDMRTILEDPLRGLAGLELYESLIQETARVFTNIAQQFQRNGIIFTKDEPGDAWNSLLP